MDPRISHFQKWHSRHSTKWSQPLPRTYKRPNRSLLPSFTTNVHCLSGATPPHSCRAGCGVLVMPPPTIHRHAWLKYTSMSVGYHLRVSPWTIQVAAAFNYFGSVAMTCQPVRITPDNRDLSFDAARPSSTQDNDGLRVIHPICGITPEDTMSYLSSSHTLVCTQPWATSI